MPGRSAKYFPLLFAGIFIHFISVAQPPGYYSSAGGLTGNSLQQALHDIIDNHIVLDYSTLPGHFQSTDRKIDGKVWDMYSDIPGGTPFYTFDFNQDECGNYSQEGDCFNREHSFPKSWFNDLSPMYTDLFHIYPADGWVNGKRANYPYGITASPAWTSTNGSRLGPSSYTGYNGIVFEPINSYKGDFARTYFYMAVRYYGEDSGWTGSDMVTGSQPKEWALKMLMEWDLADPVSQKEKDRNEAVYLVQGNRNPFIDNPSYTNLIWGTQSRIDNSMYKKSVRIWPVPAKESVTIELPAEWQTGCDIRVIDISGREIHNITHAESPVRIYVTGFDAGYYILILKSGREVITTKIVVLH
ncbi:MAG: endonuclease [Bacteroidales bacterium]|nr:endonuclease [Bacteroidales bacterium]